MSPEQQASLLAEWLASPPGADPPPGLDPDVVEGIYVLRPERAPAARVSVEDILAGLDLAPEASPAPPVEAEVVPLAPRRPMRYGALIGALAAAAMALLVVLPSRDQAPSVGPAEQAVAPAEPAPEGALMPEAVLSAPMAEPKPEPAARAKSVEPKDLAPTSPPPAPAEQPYGGVAQAPKAGSAPSPLTEMDADLGEVAVADEEAEPPKVAEGRTNEAGATTGDVVMSAPAREESARARPGSRGGGTTASSNVATPAPASAPVATGAKATGSVDQLRATANPADYRSDWYTGADAATAQRVQALVDRASAAGPGDRAAIYAEGIADTDNRVAQDMAGRAASAKLDARSYGDALRYTQRGISRSSTNTAFLARLYYLQGRAYEGMGNTEAAAAAYGRATSLNLER